VNTPPATPPYVADFAKECKAIAHVDGGAGALCCYLPIDHDGPHWDRPDNLSWQAGAPDA
jgi:hypothetical protein